MKRFNSILVAVDTRSAEHPLVQEAVEIAQRNGGSLKLVDVLPDPTWLSSLVTDELGHLQELLGDEKKEKLESLATPLRESGIEVTTKLFSGKTSVEIIKEVQRGDHDLVMSVAKGASSKSLGYFGQTARRLLRQCPCAVWLVAADANPKPRHVVACVDVRGDDPIDAELNDKVYELGFSLGEQYDSQLSIVQSWNLEDEMLLSHRLKKAEVEHYAKQRLQHHGKRMEKFLGQHDASLGNVHFVKGHTAETIPAFASDNNVDLVVMGTVGRSWLSGLVIGNTAEKVLDRIQRSVLALKPYRFRSSIRADE